MLFLVHKAFPNLVNGEIMVQPRNLALVKFNFDALPKESHSDYRKFKGCLLLFLGEIPNMPGHCVVMDVDSSKIHSGSHTENFVELSNEET